MYICYTDNSLGSSFSMERIIDLFNKILSVFSTFQLTDFLDILFVAIVIYVCIRIVRETRAMQLIKAIILLAIIYGVVSLLNMEASSFIFGSLFKNAILILVVLFTPDIRNILEQIGKGTAKRNFSTLIHAGVAVEVKQIEHTIEAVCKSCAEMSDKKVGALIVFEDETLLGDVIESGTMINADASKELVENIFFPKSPLHDGAMVIRSGKVYAAGCILPLTTKEVSSSLGTRHRAAIGVTERSDAVAIVVSEETGAISYARKGKLKHGISDGDLRDVLTTRFLPSGSSSDDKIINKLVRRVRK